MLTTLHAIWQADSAFPSGAFAFSGGLEGLTAQGFPAGRAGLAAVMRDIVLRRWATADRVALSRAHRAAGDLDVIAAADHELEVATLAAPFREGSSRNGAAFLAAHARLGLAEAQRLQQARAQSVLRGHLPVIQGAIFRALGLDCSTSIAAAGYAAVAAIATAAVRLGHIGAIDAQSVIANALPLLAELAATPPPEHTPIEGFLPLLDIAAARHARAGVRLFAN